MKALGVTVGDRLPSSCCVGVKIMHVSEEWQEPENEMRQMPLGECVWWCMYRVLEKEIVQIKIYMVS